MNQPLYRARSLGPSPRMHEQLPGNTKRGLVAILSGALDSNQLAKQFPEQCTDGNGICGTHRSRAIRTIEAFVPDLEWPPSYESSDGVIFDLIEFFAQRVAQPTQEHWHDFFRHYELEFDREKGRSAFIKEVNAMLLAGRTVFELTPEGRVERIGTPEVQRAISDLRPNTGDHALDTLIVDARHLYSSTKPADRQLGLEKLWDAFERLKTVEPGKDKRSQVDALLQRIPSEPLRMEVEAEMRALTAIGNTFTIRHHETSKHAVPEPEGRDYLFSRLSVILTLLLKVSGRLA